MSDSTYKTLYNLRSTSGPTGEMIEINTKDGYVNLRRAKIGTNPRWKNTSHPPTLVGDDPVKFAESLVIELVAEGFQIVDSNAVRTFMVTFSAKQDWAAEEALAHSAHFNLGVAEHNGRGTITHSFGDNARLEYQIPLEGVFHAKLIGNARSRADIQALAAIFLAIKVPGELSAVWSDGEDVNLKSFVMNQTMPIWIHEFLIENGCIPKPLDLANLRGSNARSSAFSMSL